MKFRFVGEEPNDGITSIRFLKILEKWKRSTDAYAIQRIFVYEHAFEFFDLFEKRYLQKILEDIHYILTMGWAQNISLSDFYHGHICGKSQKVIRDMNALLSVSNICLLYHTFEHNGGTWLPQAINRNILSFPQAKPKVVHPNYEFCRSRFYTVHSSDLGLNEYAKIFFEKTLESPYQLKDGTKLDIWGKFP